MKRSALLFRSRWYSSKAQQTVSYMRRTTEELTGQADVSLAQKQVREKRNELKTWRQRVADATTRYEDVQQRLRHVYAMKTQLYQAQRRDVVALQAINSEEETLLSEEQTLAEEMESLKQEERQCFDALGDSILSSHEQERAQSEKMKYYSRLGSILGAVVGFAGSNMFLRREVRRHQKRQEEKMDDLEKTLGGSPLHKDPADIIAEGLEGYDKEMRQAMRQAVKEENGRQLVILEGVQRDIASLSVGGGGYLGPNHVVTGLGLFVLSYALCAVASVLTR